MYPYQPPPRSGTPIWVWILGGCGVIGCLGFCGVIYTIYFLGKTVVDSLQQMTADMQASAAFLKVQDQKLVTYKGQKYVVGTLKNTSKVDSYSDTTVDFPIYDAAGNHVDTAEDAAQAVLKPGQTRRFRALVNSSAAATAARGQAQGWKVTDDSNLDPETKAERDKIIADTKTKIQKTVDEAKKREGGAGPP